MVFVHSDLSCTMTEDYEGFVRDAEEHLQDGFLDQYEMEILIRRSSRFGVDASVAEKLLIRLCLEKSITIEHFELEILQRNFQMASVDGLIDEGIRRRMVRRSSRVLLNPHKPETEEQLQARVEKMIENLGISSEDAMKRLIKRDLVKVARKSVLPAKELRQIYAQNQLEVSEGSTDVDLVDLFCDSRREVGLEVRETVVSRGLQAGSRGVQEGSRKLQETLVQVKNLKSVQQGSQKLQETLGQVKNLRKLWK